MHALEAPAGRRRRPRRRARDDAGPLRRAPGALPPATTATASTCGSPRCSAASASARTTSARPTETVLGRLADAHRAGQAAARPARACCCSTSRPTISISTRATGSRSTSSTYPHAVILVSHDRYFLDAVVTRITDLNLRTLTDYVGNYSKYVEQRDAMLERLRQAKRDQDEEVARVEDVRRSLPLPGDQGGAGPEPDQDAREGGADRGAAGAQAGALHLPDRAQERPHGARAEGRAQGLRRHPRLRRHRPADRARRSRRADRPERRRQVDADAHALGRRGAGRRHAHRGPSGRDAVLRPGRGDAPRADAHRLRDARGRLAGPDGAGDPHHPRRLPLRRRRHLQEGRRPLGRRAHAAGGGADAAPARQHAAPRRADQPPRHGFEGRPARRARGLRRHA